MLTSKKATVRESCCDSQPISNYHTVVRTVQLNATDTLSFRETLDLPAHIKGVINLVPKTSESKENFKATASISASDDGKMLDSIQFLQFDSGMELTNVKHHKHHFFRPRPCLFINITLAIDPDTELDLFGVHSYHLSVRIDASFFLQVKETTVISLHNGDVSSSVEPTGLTSRETIIESGNGDITGTYTLADLLSLRANNGRVQVSVIPEPESEDDPRAAELTITAPNGDITVDVPTTDLPRRGYVTSIRSSNGHVKGSVVHGSSTCIYARNGFVNVDVTPVHSGENITHLSASAGSGDVFFRLKSPVSTRSEYVDEMKSMEDNDPEAILGKIHSEHQSFNGQLQLHYPGEWKGQYHGSSLNGRVVVTDGNRTVVDNDGSHVSGHKGEDGTGDIKFSSLNGRVELHLG